MLVREMELVPNMLPAMLREFKAVMPIMAPDTGPVRCTPAELESVTRKVPPADMDLYSMAVAAFLLPVLMKIFSTAVADTSLATRFSGDPDDGELPTEPLVA